MNAIEAWIAALPMALIARVCLVAMFPFSALDKLLHWREALGQATSSIVPASWAPAMLVLAMACEIVTPICIVSGWWARTAAFVLAGYCVFTALLFHRFWIYGDFWRRGESTGRTHFWDFTKNFGLVGGLLLVMAGRGF